MAISSGGDIQFGVRITADNKVFVDGVQASQKEVDKLGDGLKKLSGEQGATTKSQESLTGAVVKGGAALELLKMGADLVVESFKTMREEARAAEVAQIKLNTVLQATSFSSLKTAADIDHLSESMARSTFFDATQIKEAAAQVATFGEITGRTFDRVLQAGANLATLFGGDLNSRTQQVARALTEPATSLTSLERVVGKFSPELKDLVKKLTELGDVSAAQTVILDELEKKTGNVSQTMRVGMRAATDDLAKSWRDLMQEMGKPGMMSEVGAKAVSAVADQLTRVKTIMESGDWVVKAMALLGIVTGGGAGITRAPAQAGGGDLSGAQQRRDAEQAARMREEIAEQDYRATLVAIANSKKAKEAKQKDWEELSRHWVDYIDESIDQEKRLSETVHDITKKRLEDRQKLVEASLKAELKAEEMFQDDLREAWAEWGKYLAKEKEKAVQQWGGFIDGIEGAFRQTWDAMGGGAKNAAEVAKQAFQRTFFDWLYQMAAKPIVLNIVAAMGSGIPGLASAAQAAGGGGLNLGSLFGSVGSFFGGGGWGASSTGLAVAGSEAGGGTAALGALGWIGAIVAGMMANDKFFKQGWRRDDQDGAANFTSAGVYDFDRLLRGLGLSDRIASLLSGSSLHTRLFGRGAVHADAYGLSGTVTSTGVNGAAWQDFSRPGGTFRSDQRWTDSTPLTAAQGGLLGDMFSSVAALTGSLGRSLGVNAAGALAGYNRPFNVQMSNNGEYDPTALGDLFASVLQDQVATVFDASGNSNLAAFVRSLTGAADEITETVGSLVSAFENLREIDLGTFLADLNKGPMQVFQDMGRSLLDLSGKAKLGVDGLQQLASATADYRTTVAQMVAALEGAKREIGAMFGATARGIKFQNLDGQGRYNFLQGEADSLLSQIQGSSNVGDIRAWAAQINQNINQAFGMLDPEQQRALEEEYLTRIENTNRLVQERLAQVQSETVNEANEILRQIKDALELRAADFKAAADTMLTAAGTRREVDIQVEVFDTRSAATVVNEG